MPMVHVFDLDYNEIKNEIVAATYARSIMTYSVDSLLQEDISVSTEDWSETNNIEKIKIFPSPASSQITLNFNNPESGRAYDLVVLDNNGRVVRQIRDQQNGTVELNMDVENLAAGNYTVKVKIRHTIYTGRFVKIWEGE